MGKVYHEQGRNNNAIDILMNSINIMTKCYELQDINNKINESIDVNEYKNNLIKEAYSRIENEYSQDNVDAEGVKSNENITNNDLNQPNSILELELLLSQCDEFTINSASFTLHEDDIVNEDFDILYPSHTCVDIARIYSLMGMIMNDMNNEIDSKKYLTISINMCNDLINVANDDNKMTQSIHIIKNKCDKLMNIFEKEDIIHYDNDEEEFTPVKTNINIIMNKNIISEIKLNENEKEDIEDDYEVEIVENLTIETVNMMITPDGKHDKNGNNISPDSVMSPLLF
jgi:hypothetical protein